MRSRQRLRILSASPRQPRVELFGSDRRVPGGIIGRCKLCCNRGRLQLSHIEARWIYEGLKSEGGVIGRYRSMGLETFEQDGSKHYLLCDTCEQRLGACENYLRVVSVGYVSEQRRAGVVATPEGITGIDGDRIKRAVLGILFKSVFSTSLESPRIELSPRSLAGTRRHLLGIAAMDLQLCAIRFTSTIAPGIDPLAVTAKAWVPSFKAPLFTLLAGGWEWFLFLGPAAALEGTCFQGYELRDGDVFTPLLADITLHRIISPHLYAAEAG